MEEATGGWHKCNVDASFNKALNKVGVEIFLWDEIGGSIGAQTIYMGLSVNRSAHWRNSRFVLHY